MQRFSRAVAAVLQVCLLRWYAHRRTQHFSTGPFTNIGRNGYHHKWGQICPAAIVFFDPPRTVSQHQTSNAWADRTVQPQPSLVVAMVPQASAQDLRRDVSRWALNLSVFIATVVYKQQSDCSTASQTRPSSGASPAPAALAESALVLRCDTLLCCLTWSGISSYTPFKTGSSSTHLELGGYFCLEKLNRRWTSGVHERRRNLLSDWATVSFSVTTVLHGIK
jgi:hypothetical protein